jgi:hypothetical protein
MASIARVLASRRVFCGLVWQHCYVPVGGSSPTDHRLVNNHCKPWAVDMLPILGINGLAIHQQSVKLSLKGPQTNLDARLALLRSLCKARTQHLEWCTVDSG